MTALHVLTGMIAAATVASTGVITGLAATDTAQQQALKAQAKAAAAQQAGAGVVDRAYRTVVSESVTTAAASGGSLTPSPKPTTSAKASKTTTVAKPVTTPKPVVAPKPAAPKPAAPKPAPAPVVSSGS